MDEHDVGSLLKKVRKGDAEALVVLCEYFYPQVLKYMYYRVGEVSAEDLTGEVFLRVLRHIGEQSGLFVAWLYRIAANVVTDYARMGKIRREGSIDEQLTQSIVNGKNPADVAEITGRSEGAIRGLQFRALSALRLILSGEEQTNEH